MSWWSRNKKILLLTVVGVLVSVGLVIISLMMLGPIIGSKFCKLVDCVGDGVHLNFIGETPDSYTVEIEFPSGKRKIVCKSDSLYELYLTEDHCKPNGVFFEQLDSQEPSDLPPEELKVTIAFDEKIITKTFRPDYEIWRDFNGEDCPPMCYFATIEFDLSE
jgi:hypothetical protein